MGELDILTDLNGIITQDQDGEPEEVVLATITEIGTDGVKIQVDGNEEAGDKEYKVNSVQMFAVGDRVKIHKNSGTYLVEYVVGAPMSRYPIPSGGTVGQYLKKSGENDYEVAWESLPATHGVPSGGSANQVLTKNSGIDYDVKWADPPVNHDLPEGGAKDKVLVKKTAADYDVKWDDAPNGLPSGGSVGQVLEKKTATNYDVQWADPSAMQLKNGSYIAKMDSNGNIIPNQSYYKYHIGSTSSHIGNIYADGYISLGSTSSSGVGFFGKTPQSQQYITSSSPTVSDVITVLKTYGLLRS